MRRLVIYASIIMLALLVGCSDEECDPSTYKLSAYNGTNIAITINLCGYSHDLEPGRTAEKIYGEQNVGNECPIQAFPSERYVQYVRLRQEEFRRDHAKSNINPREFFEWEDRMTAVIAGARCSVTLRSVMTHATVLRDSDGRLALRCGD